MRESVLSASTPVAPHPTVRREHARRGSAGAMTLIFDPKSRTAHWVKGSCLAAASCVFFIFTALCLYVDYRTHFVLLNIGGLRLLSLLTPFPFGPIFAFVFLDRELSFPAINQSASFAQPAASFSAVCFVHLTSLTTLWSPSGVPGVQQYEPCFLFKSRMVTARFARLFFRLNRSIRTVCLVEDARRNRKPHRDSKLSLGE